MKISICDYVSLIVILIWISTSSCLYFEVKGDKEKCFLEEFHKNSVVVIKYHLYGVDLLEEENQKLIESIQIKFLGADSHELISRHIIRSLKGKFSFTVDHDGDYKICARNVVSSWLRDKKIYMKMKIESDSQDEVNLERVVKSEDINPVSEKIHKIILKAKAIIEKQTREFSYEDIDYRTQQAYSVTLIIFTVIQICFVLGIGIYHLYSFRKYLVSNKVINK